MSEIEAEKAEVQKTISMVQSMNLSLCGKELYLLTKRFGERNQDKNGNYSFIRTPLRRIV